MCCRVACQIPKRSDHLQPIYRCIEISRDLVGIFPLSELRPWGGNWYFYGFRLHAYMHWLVIHAVRMQLTDGVHVSCTLNSSFSTWCHISHQLNTKKINLFTFLWDNVHLHFSKACSCFWHDKVSQKLKRCPKHDETALSLEKYRRLKWVSNGLELQFDFTVFKINNDLHALSNAE